MNWRVYVTFYAHKARVSIDVEANDTLWQLVLALVCSGDVVHVEITPRDALANDDAPERIHKANYRRASGPAVVETV